MQSVVAAAAAIERGSARKSRIRRKSKARTKRGRAKHHSPIRVRKSSLLMRAKVAAAFDSDSSEEGDGKPEDMPPLNSDAEESEEDNSGGNELDEAKVQEGKEDSSVIMTPGLPPVPSTVDKQFVRNDDSSISEYEPGSEEELEDSGVSDDADYRARMQLARQNSVEETASDDEPKPTPATTSKSKFRTPRKQKGRSHRTQTSPKRHPTKTRPKRQRRNGRPRARTPSRKSSQEGVGDGRLAPSAATSDAPLTSGTWCST